MTSDRVRTITLAAAVVATMLLPGAEAWAQAGKNCTSMQVFLGVSPKHRENVTEYIAPRLKEKFGVDLVTEVLGSANMVEKITAQLPSPRVSVAHWDVPVGITPCAQGLCEPIDLVKTPNVTRLYDWAYTKDPTGNIALLATNVIGIGLIYNEDSFKKAKLAPPTSWDDLTRPDLKGRISIVSPVSTWGTAALVQWAKIAGGSETNIEPGFARVKTMMSNMHTVYTWSSELSNLLQLGEVWLAVTGSNMAPAMRTQGLPTKWILPKEGAPITSGGVSIVKGAPCQEAAAEYINLYYSDEFQAMRMRDGGLASPSKSAWNFLSAADRDGLDLKPSDFDKLVNFDWNKIAAERPEWIKRWQREVR